MAQYEKTHATTVIATAVIAPNRFVAANGGYATTSGNGSTDALGVSETSAQVGEAFAAVTNYSYPVELGGTVTLGQYVQPGTDGKAVSGTAAAHCGLALKAGAAGDVVEIRLLQHVHG